MLSRVKFLRQTPAKLLETETPDLCDKEIYHISYKDLVWQLQRPGQFLVKFGQTELDVKDQASYEAMHHLRLIIAVYRPKRLTTIRVIRVDPMYGQTQLADRDVLHAHYKDFKDALTFPGNRVLIQQGLHRVMNKVTYQCLKYDRPIYAFLYPYVRLDGPWGG